ncbi:hypothetical protein COV93_00800 [Candidatus Woesearchaeota archaeon CG11_big_fil_rev_8_21_14_0_20_43_8]|nr:MAG: hypothetical protein COV93_00800 [Candidatus Woesearchaeota archaeon CG11_big_fil_rev_8_21_14_0_20_43_8]
MVKRLLLLVIFMVAVTAVHARVTLDLVSENPHEMDRSSIIIKVSYDIIGTSCQAKVISMPIGWKEENGFFGFYKEMPACKGAFDLKVNPGTTVDPGQPNLVSVGIKSERVNEMGVLGDNVVVVAPYMAAKSVERSKETTIPTAMAASPEDIQKETSKFSFIWYIALVLGMSCLFVGGFVFHGRRKDLKRSLVAESFDELRQDFDLTEESMIQLVGYVHRSRLKGAADSMLHQELVSSGWDTSLVDELLRRKL